MTTKNNWRHKLVHQAGKNFVATVTGTDLQECKQNLNRQSTVDKTGNGKPMNKPTVDAMAYRGDIDVSDSVVRKGAKDLTKPVVKRAMKTAFTRNTFRDSSTVTPNTDLKVPKVKPNLEIWKTAFNGVKDPHHMSIVRSPSVKARGKSYHQEL